MSSGETCDSCGKNTVEQTAEGLVCTSCRKVVKPVRAVHHEGFPHVVVPDDEQEP